MYVVHVNQSGYLPYVSMWADTIASARTIVRALVEELRDEDLSVTLNVTPNDLRARDVHRYGEVVVALAYTQSEFSLQTIISVTPCLD